MRTCAVEGCSAPVAKTRRMCATHYSRWRRHGDPLVKSTGRKVSNLTLDELLEEIQWLLDGGVDPLTICDQLGVIPESLRRRLTRNGLHELAQRFRVDRAA